MAFIKSHLTIFHSRKYETDYKTSRKHSKMFHSFQYYSDTIKRNRYTKRAMKCARICHFYISGSPNTPERILKYFPKGSLLKDISLIETSNRNKDLLYRKEKFLVKNLPKHNKQLINFCFFLPSRKIDKNLLWGLSCLRNLKTITIRVNQFEPQLLELKPLIIFLQKIEKRKIWPQIKTKTLDLSFHTTQPDLMFFFGKTLLDLSAMLSLPSSIQLNKEINVSYQSSFFDTAAQSQLSKAFHKLQNIRKLTLSSSFHFNYPLLFDQLHVSTKLKQISITITGHKNIQLINTLPQALIKMELLQDLNLTLECFLESNQLNQFALELGYLSQLRSLTLLFRGVNHIFTNEVLPPIAQSILKLVSLTNLNLALQVDNAEWSNNFVDISDIFKCIKKLAQLQHLSIKLEDFPSIIVSNTSTMYLWDSLANLCLLQTFVVDFNQNEIENSGLEKLSKSLSLLKKAETITIDFGRNVNLGLKTWTNLVTSLDELQLLKYISLRIYILKADKNFYIPIANSFKRLRSLEFGFLNVIIPSTSRVQASLVNSELGKLCKKPRIWASFLESKLFS